MIYGSIITVVFASLIGSGVSKNSMFGSLYSIAFLVGFALETLRHANSKIPDLIVPHLSLAISAVSVISVIGYNIALSQGSVTNEDHDAWTAIGLRAERTGLDYAPDITVFIFSAAAEVIGCCTKDRRSIYAGLKVSSFTLGFFTLFASVVQINLIALLAYYTPWLISVICYAFSRYNERAHYVYLCILPVLVAFHILTYSVFHILAEIDIIHCGKELTSYGICFEITDTQSLIAEIALYCLYAVSFVSFINFEEVDKGTTKDVYRKMECGPATPVSQKNALSGIRNSKTSLEMDDVKKYAEVASSTHSSGVIQGSANLKQIPSPSFSTHPSNRQQYGWTFRYFRGYVQASTIKTVQSKATVRYLSASVVLALGLGYPSIFGLPYIFFFVLIVGIPRGASKMVPLLLLYTASVASIISVWNLEFVHSKDEYIVGLLDLEKVKLMYTLIGYNLAIALFALVLNLSSPSTNPIRLERKRLSRRMSSIFSNVSQVKETSSSNNRPKPPPLYIRRSDEKLVTIPEDKSNVDEKKVASPKKAPKEDQKANGGMRAQWYFVLPHVAPPKNYSILYQNSKLCVRRVKSGKAHLRPGRNSRYQWMFQPVHSGTVALSLSSEKGTTFLVSFNSRSSRRIRIKTKRPNGGFFYIRTSEEGTLATEIMPSRNGFGEFYMYGFEKDRAVGDVTRGDALKSFGKNGKDLKVFIRSGSLDEKNRKIGKYWSVSDGEVSVKLGQPHRRDVFRLVPVTQDDEEKGHIERSFKICTLSKKLYLKVLTVHDTIPTRYYLSNKNGNNEYPNRLYVKSYEIYQSQRLSRDQKNEDRKIVQPEVEYKVAVGKGTDDRFMWKTGDLLRYGTSAVITGTIQNEATKKYLTFLPENETDIKQTRVIRSTMGSTGDSVLDVKSKGVPVIKGGMRLDTRERKTSLEMYQRWDMEPVLAENGDGCCDIELWYLFIQEYISYLFIWIEITTLILMYIMACITVDLVHAVYLAFFAIFIVFTQIRKKAWVAVMIYSACVVLLLYAYQLRAFSFLHSSIPSFVGIISINRVGWSQLWAHIAVFVLSTLSWNTHRQNNSHKAAEERKVATVFLPSDLHKASIIVNIGFCGCVIAMVIVGVYSFGHNVSIINGVYVIMACVLLQLVAYHPREDSHRPKLKRLLYCAATYAGACLVIQYMYQFGILKFIDQLLDKLTLNADDAGLSKSSNLITSLAGHSLILFVCVLQIRVYFAYRVRRLKEEREARRERSSMADFESSKNKDTNEEKTESCISTFVYVPLVALSRFCFRICLLHSNKALLFTLFWYSSVNVSLYGLWRLLLALILIVVQARPDGFFCRLKTVTLLTSEQAMLVAMYLYNLLSSIIRQNQDHSCGPPPLDKSSCPDESILGIYPSNDLGAAVSGNIIIIFLISLHGLSRYQISILSKEANDYMIEIRTRLISTGSRNSEEAQSTFAFLPNVLMYGDDGMPLLKFFDVCKPRAGERTRNLVEKDSYLSCSFVQLFKDTPDYKCLKEHLERQGGSKRSSAATANSAFEGKGDIVVSTKNSLKKSQNWLDKLCNRVSFKDTSELLSHFTEMWSLHINFLILGWMLYSSRGSAIGLFSFVWIIVLLHKYANPKLWLGLSANWQNDPKLLWRIYSIFFLTLFIAKYCVFIYWIRLDQNGYTSPCDNNETVSRRDYINCQRSRFPDLWPWLEYLELVIESSSATESLVVLLFVIFFGFTRYYHLARSNNIFGSSLLRERAPPSREETGLGDFEPTGNERPSDSKISRPASPIISETKDIGLGQGQKKKRLASRIGIISESKEPTVLNKIETTPWYLDPNRDYTVGSETSDIFLRFWLRDFENWNKILILAIGSGYFNFLNFGYMVISLLLLRLTGSNNIRLTMPLWNWMALYNVFVILVRISFIMPWNKYLPDKSDEDYPPFTWPGLFGVYVDWDHYSRFIASDVAILILVTLQNWLLTHRRIFLLTNRQAIQRGEESVRGKKFREIESQKLKEKLDAYAASKKERQDTLEKLREERQRFRKVLTSRQKSAFYRRDTKDENDETKLPPISEAEDDALQRPRLLLAKSIFEISEENEEAEERRSQMVASHASPKSLVPTRASPKSSVMTTQVSVDIDGKSSGDQSLEDNKIDNLIVPRQVKSGTMVSVSADSIQRPKEQKEDKKTPKVVASLPGEKQEISSKKPPKSPEIPKSLLGRIGAATTGAWNWINAKASIITIVAFVCVFAFSPSIFSAVYPITLFGYVLLVHPRVNVNFWKAALAYTVAVIGMYYVFQLPLFCICYCNPDAGERDTYEIVWTCQERSSLTGQRKCDDTSCGKQGNTQFWGLRKFGDGNEDDGAFTFFAGAFWYFFALLSLLNQRYWLRKNGLWRTSKRDLENEAENRRSQMMAERRRTRKPQFAMGTRGEYFFEGQWRSCTVLGVEVIESGDPGDSKGTTDIIKSSARDDRTRSSVGSVSRPSEGMKNRKKLRRGARVAAAKKRIIKLSEARLRGIIGGKLRISFRYMSGYMTAPVTPLDILSSFASTENAYETDSDLWIARRVGGNSKNKADSSTLVWCAGRTVTEYKRVVEARITQKGNQKCRILVRKRPTVSERESWYRWLCGGGDSGEKGVLGDTVGSAKGIFDSILGNQNEKVGVDLYGYILGVQVLLFFVILIFFDNATQFTQGFAQSHVSASYVASIFSVFLWICIDRVIYLYCSLSGKITIQLVSIGVAMGLLLSVSKLSGFDIVVYLLIATYWALSATQYRKGYPTVILPSILKPHWFVGTLFLIYRAIPFVFELRTLLDWSCNETVLFYNEWLKLEDLWSTFYLVQCDLSWKFVAAQVPGMPQATWRKCTSGWLIFLILALVVWGPLFLFVGGPRVSLGLSKLSVSVGVPGYAPFAQTDQAVQYGISEDTWTIWKAMFDFLGGQSRSTLKSYALQYPQAATQWMIAPFALQSLQESIVNPANNLLVSIGIVKDATGSNAQSNEIFTYSSALSTDTRSKIQTVLEDAYLGTPGALPSSIDIPGCYPRFLYIPATSSPYSLSESENALANCTLVLFGTGNFSAGSGTLWFDFFGPQLPTSFPDENAPDATIDYGGETRQYREATFQIFSDTVVNLGTFSVGLIPLYLTFVYTIGQFVRLMVTGASQNIIYKDLGNAQPFLGLIKLIYLARADGQLDLEEYLYVELINILRNPQIILQMTGDYMRVFPTVIYAVKRESEARITNDTSLAEDPETHEDKIDEKDTKDTKESLHMRNISDYRDSSISIETGENLQREVEEVFKIKTPASTKITELKEMICERAGIDETLFTVKLYYKGEYLHEHSDQKGKPPPKTVSKRQFRRANNPDSKRTFADADGAPVLYDNRIYDYFIKYKEVVQFVVVPRPEELLNEDDEMGDEDISQDTKRSMQSRKHKTERKR